MKPKKKSQKQTLTPERNTDSFKQPPLKGNDESGPQYYAKWLKSLPKEQQKLLADSGLGTESYDGKVDSNWIFEVQPDHASYSTNETELQNFDEPEKPVRLYTEDDVMETIRRVVMAMQLSEDPAVLFQARCILIALGIGVPPTETELAKQKNCSRQFVSKKVKRIQQLFNLTPSQYMRSESACNAYARAWHRQRLKSAKK